MAAVLYIVAAAARRKHNRFVSGCGKGPRMSEDLDLTYLDLLAVRAMLLWPLLVWAFVFYLLLS